MILVVTPSLQRSDAIGHDVMAEREWLSQAGVEVRVFADHFSPEFAPLVCTREEAEIIIAQSSAMVIYHHSQFWDFGRELLSHGKCRVIMKYHNVTPPEYFQQYFKEAAECARKGVEQTEDFVRSGSVELFLADSRFNAGDLLRHGAAPDRVRVIPPAHKVDEFDQVPSLLQGIEELRAAKVNVLFVGRCVPNKGHRHMIATVKEYVDFYGRDIRLHMVGKRFAEFDSYHRELDALIDQLGVREMVRFISDAPFAELVEYYRRCDVFLLMSKHEGFCVPILEAQKMGVPVIALDRTAVKDTLGESQLLFKEPDYGLFASAIKIVAENGAVKKHLVERGKANFSTYGMEKLREQFLSISNLGIAI